jgi:nucleoside-diphosphate-sugar epimerase
MQALNRQSALVTGASGFIGLHLVRLLMRRGCRVACLVRPTSRVDELRAAGADLVTGDVNDRASVARAINLSNPGVVYHLAGLVRALSYADFLRGNAEAVDAVAAACNDRPERPVLLLVSSLAAAGPSGGAPKVEGDESLPVSNYGRSKRAGEEAAARYAGSLPITIVRPCVVFGAGDRGMYQIFKAVSRTGIHVVSGRGDHRVSLVAAPDLAECIVLAAEGGERLGPDGPGRGIYMAAAGDMSQAEIGMVVAAAVGTRPPRVVHAPAGLMRIAGLCGDLASWARRQPGWISSDKISELQAGSWTCSSLKAQRQLGWAPAVPLEERLRDTAQWYVEAGWLPAPLRSHRSRS